MRRTIFIVILVIMALIVILLNVVQIERDVIIYVEEGKTGEELKIVRISIAELPYRLEKEKVVVHYAGSFRELTEDVARELDQGLALIEERMGIDAAIEVALFHKPSELEERNIRIVVEEAVWPLFVESSWKQLSDVDSAFLRDLHHTMPHEAVEGVVSQYLYHDRRARWVGDGLAEYAGYLVSQRWAPSVVKARLENLRRRVDGLLQERISYNLIEDFLVIVDDRPSMVEGAAGYGVALAFWLDLTQRHGEEVIRAFWKRLSAQKTWCLIPYVACVGPNARTAARILTELTGEDIWAKLQRMDLQEVLDVLERAAQGLPEG